MRTTETTTNPQPPAAVTAVEEKLSAVPGVTEATARVGVGTIGLTIVLFAAAVVGWIFDSIDEQRGFARWDESFGEWGAARATEATTQVLDVLTQFGGSAFVVTVMIGVGLYFWQRRSWHSAAYLAAVGLGIVILNNGLKLLVDRERPDISRLADTIGSSFPSGHTATAAACWASIAYVATRHAPASRRVAAGFGAALVAIVVAATRVLLGVHWFTDVLAGLVVGWSWFGLVTVLSRDRLDQVSVPGRRSSSSSGVPEYPAG